MSGGPRHAIGLVAILVGLGIVLNAIAQSDDGEEHETVTELSRPDDTAETGDRMDEIVVIAPRAGDPIDIDALYENQLRSRIVREYRRLQLLDERNEWREADPDVNDRSRIKWGYNPQDELRMRRDTELTDLPFENTEPATIFRFEF